MRRKKETKSTTRIKKLIEKIQDPDIRSLVEEVVEIEISYRSSDRKNFPLRKIRDVVEHVGQTIENRESQS